MPTRSGSRGRTPPGEGGDRASQPGTVLPDAPRYYLPEPAIARLEQPRLGRPPLFSPEAAAAERAFLKRCRPGKAVGFVGARRITYNLIEDCGPPRRELHPSLGWNEETWQAVEWIVASLEGTRLRMKGWVGWLLTEPAFLDGLAALEAQWRSLPVGERPEFPLRRATPSLATLLGACPPACPAEVSAFVVDLEAFLDRWGLISLASWDLPEPQGPLFPSLLPPGAPALPRHGVHIVLPIGYALTGDDDLLGQIRDLQRGLVEDLGIDRSAAGLPHYKLYARIFEIIHWERALDARLPGSGRGRGEVALKIEAISETIGMEVTRVEALRKDISACRRGRRASVVHLRVPR